MPGSLTTPGCLCTRVDVLGMLPSANTTASAPGIILSRLNGWPMHSPTDASPLASRPAMHGSGSMWFAIPSSCRTFTDYSLPASRRTVFDIIRDGAKCHPANLMVPAFFLDRPKPCGPLSKGRWQGPLSRLAAFRPPEPVETRAQPSSRKMNTSEYAPSTRGPRLSSPRPPANASVPERRLRPNERPAN